MRICKTWCSKTWNWVKNVRWWAAAWVWACLVSLFGAWGLENLQDQQDELHALTRSELREEETEEATNCVSAHSRYQDLLQAIEESATAGGQGGARAAMGALIDFVRAEREANPDPEDEPIPEDIEEQLAPFIDVRVESEVRPAVEEILTHYPPPMCDLEESREILRNDRD